LLLAAKPEPTPLLPPVGLTVKAPGEMWPAIGPILCQAAYWPIVGRLSENRYGESPPSPILPYVMYRKLQWPKIWPLELNKSVTNTQSFLTLELAHKICDL
jgi:hypothetical protein